jgi:[acyl-carrier-protein] S-malonyltransferase
MGEEYLISFPELEYVFDTASGILGYDLKEVCFGSQTEKLNSTLYSQPAIAAVCVLCFEIAKKHVLTGSAVAGHSLGEYPAMYAAGMIDLESMFKLLKIRAEISHEHSRKGTGKMAAVLKLQVQTVEDILKESGTDAAIANYNSPLQSVIAGTAENVDAVCDIIKQKGGRAVPLKVSGAFHHPLMAAASDDFREQIRDFKFSPPETPFYSNLTGGKLTDFTDMPQKLANHMCNPVLFTKQLRAMRTDGITSFTELGPGKVLTKLVEQN